jgi:hypothetical protein
MTRGTFFFVLSTPLLLLRISPSAASRLHYHHSPPIPRMAHLNAEICSEFNKGCLSFAELVVMLGWKAIFTLVVVALMFIVLASNKFNDTLVIFLAYIL